jgi:hypothetical protein
MAIGGFEVVIRAIAASDSLDNIAKVLRGSLEQMTLDAAGRRSHDYHQQVALIVGDKVVTAEGYTDAQALAERARLERLGLQPIEPHGDGYVIDGKTLMVKVRASDINETAYEIFNIVGVPSMADVLVVRQFTKAIAAMAKRISGRPAVALA